MAIGALCAEAVERVPADILHDSLVRVKAAGMDALQKIASVPGAGSDLADRAG